MSKFLDWLKSLLFGTKVSDLIDVDVAPVVPLPVVPGASQTIPQRAAVPRQKKAPRQLQPWRASLSALLDNIDATFKALTIDWDALSFVDRHDVAGLKKIGPMVFSDLQIGTQTNLPAGLNLPAFMLISVLSGESSVKGDYAPDFFFATKTRKVPWHVTKVVGEVFHCGFAWRIPECKSLFWYGVYIGIDKKTGAVNLTHQMCTKTHRLTKGKSRGNSYTSTSWEKASWKVGASDTEKENAVKQCVASFIGAWAANKDNWAVSVTKAGERATFYVDPKDTKNFFKNRDKSVTNKEGAKKKIIHLVEEHTRATANGPQLVREHIRGERTFQWNGMQCHVTSPKYHVIRVDRFDRPAESYDLVEAKDLEKTGTMLSIGTLADKLHAWEDEGKKRSLDAVHGKKVSL